MGHFQQLLRTGLIQRGNDGMYILIRHFVIFKVSRSSIGFNTFLTEHLWRG